MSTRLIFGLDIGTRTTVIHYYNTGQRLLAGFKPEGDIRIPTIYHRAEIFYGNRLADAMHEGAVSPRNVAQNFKIDFWKSDDVPDAAANDLQGWLNVLLASLRVEYPQSIDDAKFCFTYPAQRSLLEPQYRDIITKAGFPGNSISFLDEPTAAAYGCIEMYSKKTAYEFSGKGLILDIGAGTTDFSIVENRGGMAGLVILDSSSTNLAGNDFTRALRDLLSTKEEMAAFDRYLDSKPYHLDRYKENFSSYYADEDNWDEQLAQKLRGVGRFVSRNLDHFMGVISSQCDALIDQVENRLSANHITQEDIKFVISTGGGALHVGLAEKFKAHFGSKFVATQQPQAMVSIGATYYAKSKYVNDDSPRIAIKNTIAAKVYLDFPADTLQEDVVIFEEDTQVPMDFKTRGRASITLESNVIFPEGTLFLCIGEYRVNLAEIDIAWSDSKDEVSFHPGVVEWEYSPDLRLLTISVSLKSTNIATAEASIVHQAEIFVLTKGEYAER